MVVRDKIGIVDSEKRNLLVKVPASDSTSYGVAVRNGIIVHGVMVNYRTQVKVRNDCKSRPERNHETKIQP